MHAISTSTSTDSADSDYLSHGSVFCLLQVNSYSFMSHKRNKLSKRSFWKMFPKFQHRNIHATARTVIFLCHIQSTYSVILISKDSKRKRCKQARSPFRWNFELPKKRQNLPFIIHQLHESEASIWGIKRRKKKETFDFKWMEKVK